MPVTRIVIAALLLHASVALPAEISFPQRLDRAALQSEPGIAKGAARADDAEFLRRIWLDLAGTIPTAKEARAFLEDPSPDKRTRLIDHLLASPAHSRHFRDVLDVLLMERRPEKHVPRAEWQTYLRVSVAVNKPWDALAQEILAADGLDPRRRAPARFFLDREAEPNLLTRDIGRVFLGRNLTCAQCHDHPLVDTYKQDEYFGIFAFLNRTSLFVYKNNPAVLADKADGEATYQSVFDPKKVTRTGRPRIPGRMPLEEPMLARGMEYVVAPAKEVRPVPRFSRRAQLASQITHPDNVAFRRNIANRLWALMTGRGLVHPPDLDHPGNPPSHPQLLELLAEEAAARGFDMRQLLREIARSETYQRSSEAPAEMKDPPSRSLAVARLKPLSPEQLAWSLMQATGLTDAERLALGKNATEEAVVARLAGNVSPFVSAFGGRPGFAETFDPTLDQALFLANGSLVRGWLTPRPGNLTERLGRLKDPEAQAEELYLSILTRRPTVEEKREVSLALRSGPTALPETIWALLASAEFRFNH